MCNVYITFMTAETTTGSGLSGALSGARTSKMLAQDERVMGNL